MPTTFQIDEKHDSYQPFFDHASAQQIDQAASGPPLAMIVFDLCSIWKSVSNTHSLPLVMFELLKSFAKEYLGGRDYIGREYVKLLTRRLPGEVGSLSHMKRKQLGEAFERIYVDIPKRESDVMDAVVVNVWKDEIMPNFDFTTSVWSSQRLCYGATYYAYEDFLVRTYRALVNKPDYRLPNAREFGVAFENAFTAELRDFCFSGEVNVARLARNALAHNGGRETDELRKEKHSLIVTDGEIQIMPSNNRALFDLLKERATRVVAEAILRLSKP